MTPFARQVLARAALAGLAAVLLASGCASLEEKEREWTFRVVKEDAGWYSGMPAGVTDVYLPVSDAPGAQKIHAWWWPAAASSYVICSDGRSPSLLPKPR